MDLNCDIARYGIPHQCSQCIFKYGCTSLYHNKPNPHCGEFVPNNMDLFLNDTITYFKLFGVKSKDKRLKRVCSYHGGYNDNVTTLDSYYTNFINDCLSELRKGRMVYVFKLSQVWEILKFVDNVKAIYQGDGIIGLTCKETKSKSKKQKRSRNNGKVHCA